MNDKAPYKNTSRQTDARRTKRLYVAVEHFEYSPELAKRVYHLGIPYFTDYIQTASLTVTKKGKPIFNFNRAFFDGLGQIELVFVVLHEVLHFVFYHHSRCHDRLPALWNVAADLVTNAFLLQKIGFAEVSNRSFHEFLESAITFTNLPIAPTNDMLLRLTAEEVYDLLAENLQGIQGRISNLKACDEHTWLGPDADGDSGLGDSLGENLEGIEEKPSGSKDYDEHISSEPDDVDGVPEQGELLDELAERAQQIFRNWLPSWGNTPSGELRAIGEIDDTFKIDWSFILSRRIVSCIRLTFEQRWAPPNRKIAWLYPKVLLPADHQIEQYQPSLVLAIDASGSISQPVLDRLLGVARSIPTDQVQLTTISFDVRVYPVDIWENVPEIRGGGGTSFKAVENFARQLKQYPDLIVVLTDGCAQRPDVQHPDRWFWLITEHGIIKHIEDVGRYYRINCPGQFL